MATFKALVDDALERCNYDASLASSTPRTRLTRFANEWHRRILVTPGLTRLRDDTIPFASVADQAQYALPQSVQKIRGIQDRTSDRHLGLIPLEAIRREDPGLDSTGTPTSYAIVGQQQVAAHPSDASSLFVDSTSGSDTNTAYVEGIRTGGYPSIRSVTMTGTTAVDVSAAITDWIQVTKFYLSSLALGTVTLHEDASGGTELARIAIGEMYARYLWIQLWPTASAAVTYYVDYEREIPDMANDTDEPFLPRDFHWLISAGARLNEYERMDDNRAPALRGDVEDGIRKLILHVSNPPGYVVVPGMDGPHTSTLGSWTPAGS